MRGKKVKSEIKTKILKEALESDCDISELAKSYNLSPKTINHWKQNHKKQQKTTIANKFVELKSISANELPKIKQMELTLDGFSCCIEGRLSSKQFLKLLTFLEECQC